MKTRNEVKIITNLTIKDAGSLINYAKAMGMTVEIATRHMIRHYLLFSINEEDGKAWGIQK